MTRAERRFLVELGNKLLFIIINKFRVKYKVGPSALQISGYYLIVTNSHEVCVNGLINNFQK